jgi:hemolysin III
MTRINNTSVAEEIANSITHGLGTLLGIVALVFLMVIAVKSNEPVKIAGFAVYGASLILLYLMSTLYHSLMFTKAHRIFRFLDHAAIFLFIAGSFTPFILITIQHAGRWVMLSAIWVVALSGIVYCMFNIRKTNILLVFYLLMGWLGLFIFQPLFQYQHAQGLALLLAGGILYTLGTVFYTWKKLVFHHSIWHVFVLLATVCHFISIIHL